MNIFEFLDWVNSVDKFFKNMEVQEDKQVKMVTYNLKGWASV